MITKDYEFEWCGTRVLLRHVHKFCGVIERLEIKTIDPEKAPLPITETGYRSHFVDEAIINAYGNPLAYVLAWLDEAAINPEWQRQKEVSNQYSLF